MKRVHVAVVLLALAIEAEATVPAAPSWPNWFAKNTLVTEKAEYVHILWNARDAMDYFQGPEKKARLAEAARQLVLLEYSKGTRDRVRMDIVLVRDRDQYGLPKWDTLQKVAHLEFSRSRLLHPSGAGKPAASPVSLEAFDKFELSR